MNGLEGKRVLLGVTGGIAAYKAPALIRAFRAEGAEVRVILSRSAEQFVTPMAVQVVSENRVGRDLFEPGYEYEIGHIELARWADVCVVAPASANVLARARYGLSDDLLTTVLLATTAPVVFCPSMNTQMLFHPATQENIRTLQKRDRCFVVASDEGQLACKEVGAGRLPDPPTILSAARRVLTAPVLAARHVVVTAGPTRERFDPVRFISNPSSGKMGFAIAEAAKEAGARVTLVHGPVAIEPPDGVEAISAVTAQAMRDAVHEHAKDVLVMTAAVGDWRPQEVALQKRKKTDGAWTPTLVRTTDILAELAESAVRPRVVVGFAAETHDVLEYAQKKLVEKRLDGIVANSVAGLEGAFGNDENTVFLVRRGSEPEQVGPASKSAVARRLVQWFAQLGEG